MYVYLFVPVPYYQENLNQVLSIQRSLQDYNDPLVTPGRTFLKKGKLYKSAGKTTHLKMFFLVSHSAHPLPYFLPHSLSHLPHL